MGEQWKGAAALAMTVGLFALLLSQVVTGYEQNQWKSMPPSDDFLKAHQIFVQHEREWETAASPALSAPAIAVADIRHDK